MSEETKLIAEHYQKTYELTFELWRERNRTFLLLLGLIGLATILTFRISQTDILSVDLLAKWLDIKDQQAIKDLKGTFPYTLLLSIFQVIVFYLMVNLYHRNHYVLRNYAYLACMEKDIRSCLTDQNVTASFTREGEFYWNNRPSLFALVKWAYIVLLGLLLLAFLIGHLIDDCGSGNRLLVAVDLIMGASTLLFFYGYASSSVRLDTRNAASSSTPPKKPSSN